MNIIKKNKRFSLILSRPLRPDKMICVKVKPFARTQMVQSQPGTLCSFRSELKTMIKRPAEAHKRGHLTGISNSKTSTERVTVQRTHLESTIHIWMDRRKR